MGLCLLLPLICAKDENNDNSSIEDETDSVKKVKIHSARKSNKANKTFKEIKTSSNLRICRLCHKRVSISSLPVAKNFSINTPNMDDGKRIGTQRYLCSCNTSYLRSQ